MSLRKSARIASTSIGSQLRKDSPTVETSRISKRRKTTLANAQSTTLSPSGIAQPETRAQVAAGVEITTTNAEQPPVARKKRARAATTWEEPIPENYAPRAVNSWKIGAHVSAAGGVENAVQNAASIGANAFALFLKSQRKWSAPDLTSESISRFKSRLQAFGYEPAHVLPHGNYLINLGNPDSEKREKSYDCFLDELRRCEQLGLTLYNFHPGSTVGSTTPEESISLVSECINKAHKSTQNVITVIEIMAGSGNVIGSSFREISEMIRGVEDKGRVGVCLDTCHMFSAGYDIRSIEAYNQTMSEFEREIGFKYLRGMHFNDSKCALRSKKDRHENISLGHIGLKAFAHILRDPRIQDIPLILETPSFESQEVWKTEIEVLNSISGTSPDDIDDAKLTELSTKIAQVVKANSPSDSGKKTKGKTQVKKRKRKEKEDAVSSSDLSDID